MRLSIEHETLYRFAEPALHSTQVLRLTPRPDPSQMVVRWSVTTGGKVQAWTDGFGNLAHLSVQDGRHDEVIVKVAGEIETQDTHGVLPPDDGLPPLMFLRETSYTELNDEIRALAEPFAERRDDEGVIAALHALNWTLHETVRYQPGETDVTTTAAEALARGLGVCQDHAHLFIACCRVLAVPARYVSGYPYTGDGEAPLAGHAWAEASVDELGWVAFDPANAICATDAYVRLAIAMDYDGASPVRGIRRGGGFESLNVRVRVERNDGQRQSQSQSQ